MADYDFTIDQYASFNHVLVWKDSAGVPINLTGATARMMIKPKLSAPALVTLSTDDGSIVIEPLTGTITLKLTPVQTALLIFVVCVYDLFITDSNGVATKLLDGKVNIEMAVTK